MFSNSSKNDAATGGGCGLYIFNIVSSANKNHVVLAGINISLQCHLMSENIASANDKQTNRTVKTIYW